MARLRSTVLPCVLVFKFLLLHSAAAEQHQYKLITKNLTLQYTDRTYIDTTVGLFERSQENAVNITFTLKCDLPENTMASIKALKWLRDGYLIPTLQLRKSIKDMLEMESFDLQSLWLRYSKPAVVWPLTKGVTYRATGWIPDSTRFPPNIPGGKWMLTVTVEFANKTKLSVVHWYFNIEYYK